MLTSILANCDSFPGPKRCWRCAGLRDWPVCLIHLCRGARDPHLQSTAPAFPRSWTPPSRTWPGSTDPAGACRRAGAGVNVIVTRWSERGFDTELTFPVETTGSCQSYQNRVAAVSQWPPKTTRRSLVDKLITNVKEMTAVVKMPLRSA